MLAERWTIDELHTEEGRLDDVFRSLTGGLPRIEARLDLVALFESDAGLRDWLRRQYSAVV